jgi:hypothetical protein
VITTDTDWNTSRLTVDDTEVEDHKASLFEVRSLLAPVDLQIDRLTRDQKQVDARPEQDCHVLVENDSRRVYIRRGLNQNNGSPQHDCFVLRRDGSIDSPIDWQYDEITRVDARPIEDTRLFLRGGIFTTFANCMKQELGYNYWSRNIVISRSNTEVDGLTHYVVVRPPWDIPSLVSSAFASVPISRCATASPPVIRSTRPSAPRESRLVWALMIITRTTW